MTTETDQIEETVEPPEPTLADDLRLLADFLDEHPDLKPTVPSLYVFPSTEEQWRVINSQLGPFTKRSSSYDLEAIKQFGRIKFSNCIMHEKVCEKKIVGTREVVKEVPIGGYKTEVVQEDIVEWVCPPEWR